MPHTGAHLDNFYPQLLVPLLQDALYETLSVYYSVLLGLISILLDNKSYGPVGICSTKLYASSPVYLLLASSLASNDRDQTLKTFLGFIVAYNEHKV